MDFATPEGQQRYDTLVAHPEGLLVGLDFDGTLAPIVADPTEATIAPRGPALLARLADHVGLVAIVTGRPARQVVELAHLEQVAKDLGPDARLLVLGQYGHESWDARTGEYDAPEAHTGLEDFRAELPALLEAEGAQEAYVEEKGLAVAVHTRRLDDAAAVFDRLRESLSEAAERHGLALEPGKLVLEVRTPGMDKGMAVRAAVAEHGSTGVVFVGDDLGDLEAFEAVRELRAGGMPALLVCSGSEEQQALASLADLVVEGPPGVIELLESFASDAAAPAG